MAKRAISRERAHGRDEDAGTFDDGSRVWLWNIDSGGRDLEIADLMEKWDDFIPGYAEGKWFVDGVSLADPPGGVGSDFIVVQQSWRRIENENPLFKPFRWTGMESIDVEIPTFWDVDGKIVATTAGEPILGVTVVQRVWRFTFEKNIPGIPAWVANYGKSVNADTVRIGTVSIPPNCLQLQKLTIGDEDDSTSIAGRKIIFRPMTGEVWWNPATWTTTLLNAGFYELVNVAPRGKPVFAPVRITNGGNPVDRPQFLNASGQRPRDKAGNVKTLLTPNELHVLHFNFNDRLPYSKLFR